MAGTTGLEPATSDVTGENASRLFSVIYQPFRWLAGDTRRQGPTRNDPLSQALVTQLVTHRRGCRSRLPVPDRGWQSDSARGICWVRHGPDGNFRLSVSLRSGILRVGRPGQHPQPNNNPFYPEGEAIIYRIDHGNVGSVAAERRGLRLWQGKRDPAPRDDRSASK